MDGGCYRGPEPANTAESVSRKAYFPVAQEQTSTIARSDIAKLGLKQTNLIISEQLKAANAVAINLLTIHEIDWKGSFRGS
ncbi:hypothetical protein E4U61_006860 [Claviceps capensis]|nr:hypothetical protein E4U61_006860 [Claviceps capensis]